MSDYKLRYPIGEFLLPDQITREEISNWIEAIESFPTKLKFEIQNLTQSELKFKYRPGGWSINQIVHHCADSHLNSFIRFKLTLTENVPSIKPYFEARWAELPDVRNSKINSSLKIIEGVHERWSILLNNLEEDDLKKEFFHPESNETVSLRKNIGIYAWHCEHHLEHIRIAKRSKLL